MPRPPKKSTTTAPVTPPAPPAPKKVPVEIAIMANLEKAFKGGNFRTLAKAAEQDRREFVPTTINVLDHYVMGWGGLLIGRCTEVFGEPDTGKTSLLFRCLASAQQQGGVGMLIESERTLVHERGIAYGINPERLILSEPRSINDVLDQILEAVKLIPKGVGPNLIGWDSLASSSAEGIYEGKNPAGAKARAMSDYFPAITYALREKRAHLLVINQVRSKIGAFGDPTTSPGGGTLKFLASARLQLWRGKNIDGVSDVLGHHVTIKSIKNKMWPNYRKVKLRLDYAKGWNNDWADFNLAKDLELIEKDTDLSTEAVAEARKHLIAHESWWKPEKAV